MIDEQVARLRREYETMGLIEDEMATDPITEFIQWFDAVQAAGIEEPNTFVLATAGDDRRPSARALLMKGIGPNGLVFYTNLASRKSEDMRVNPVAAATFVWVPLHRQVRFEGPVSMVDDEEADRYFETRPRGAQIAAHASPQSQVVDSRRVLEEEFRDLDVKFTGVKIPRPRAWGGWRLTPDTVEFWQGRPNRFHDRVRYQQEGEDWRKERLAP